MKKDTRSKQTIQNQIRKNDSDLAELKLIMEQTCVPETKPYLAVAISQIAQAISLDALILEIEFNHKAGE